MKVTRLLSVGFGLLIVVLASQIIMIQTINKGAINDYDTLKHKVQPAIMVLEKFDAINKELDLLTQNYVFRENKENLQRINTIINTDIDNLLSQTHKLQKDLPLDDLRSLVLRDIKRQSFEIVRNTKRITEILSNAKKVNRVQRMFAEEVLDEKLLYLHQELANSLLSLKLQYNAQLDKYQETISADLKRISSFVLYAGFAGILLGIFVSIYVIRAISKPIETIRSAAINVSEGNYRSRIHIKGKSELAELARAFNAMTRNMQEHVNRITRANEELEQFAYIASHDLQEPLGVVTSFVPLLEKKYNGHIDDETKLYLKYIMEASERMSSLILGLLEYSRIGGKEKLKQVDCNVLLHEVQEELVNQIAESNAVVNIINRLPVIKAYENELKSLFKNLINNAIRYKQPDKNPLINIYASRQDNFWKFSVQDNGIGIEKEHQEKIFVIFQRVHLLEKFKGTGIGLAHCKKIAKLHDGDIWVESEINKGSTFYLAISTTLGQEKGKPISTPRFIDQ